MNRALITIALGAIAAASAAAHAVDIYAINHLGSYPESRDELIVFDSTSPSGYQTIGPLGVNNVGFGGLDFDEDGNLWAYASFFQTTGGATSGLYQVNLTTGAASVQGTLNITIMQDIAWNPVDDTMYGINTRFGSLSQLYTVNLTTGAVTLFGTLNGLPSAHALIGLAFDADGNLFVHDQLTDSIFKGEAGSILNVSSLYQLAYNTLGSQGMTFDWSRDNLGYHAMVAQGSFPNYLCQINRFYADGTRYTYGPEQFGPNHPNGLPVVQAGDLAIMPDTTIGVLGDLTGDGLVNLFDLLELLSAWGACPPSGDSGGCPADLAVNGAVDLFDLLFLLSHWT